MNFRLSLCSILHLNTLGIMANTRDQCLGEQISLTVLLSHESSIRKHTIETRRAGLLKLPPRSVTRHVVIVQCKKFSAHIFNPTTESRPFSFHSLTGAVPTAPLTLSREAKLVSLHAMPTHQISCFGSSYFLYVGLPYSRFLIKLVHVI